MTPDIDLLTSTGDEQSDDKETLPVVIATILRPDDFGGVHTHVHQILGYLKMRGTPGTLITPFSWNHMLTYPAFGPRVVLERISGSASVAWYRYWHELFLGIALRRELAKLGDC